MRCDAMRCDARAQPEGWDEEEDGLWEPPAGAAAAAVSFKDDSVGSDDPEEEATRVANVSRAPPIEHQLAHDTPGSCTHPACPRPHIAT